jgi:hypothetical protein
VKVIAMRYISLAAHNHELIVVNSMSDFTTHFCYSKKQRYDGIMPPLPENTDEATPELEFSADGDAENLQDDDILWS